MRRMTMAAGIGLGGFAGGYAGFMTAVFFVDMTLESPWVFVCVIGGAVGGAVIGSRTAGRLIA